MVATTDRTARARVNKRLRPVPQTSGEAVTFETLPQVQRNRISTLMTRWLKSRAVAERADAAAKEAHGYVIEAMHTYGISTAPGGTLVTGEVDATDWDGFYAALNDEQREKVCRPTINKDLLASALLTDEKIAAVFKKYKKTKPRAEYMKTN